MCLRHLFFILPAVFASAHSSLAQGVETTLRHIADACRRVESASFDVAFRDSAGLTGEIHEFRASVIFKRDSSLCGLVARVTVPTYGASWGLNANARWKSRKSDNRMSYDSSVRRCAVLESTAGSPLGNTLVQPLLLFDQEKQALHRSVSDTVVADGATYIKVSFTKRRTDSAWVTSSWLFDRFTYFPVGAIWTELDDGIVSSSEYHISNVFVNLPFSSDVFDGSGAIQDSLPTARSVASTLATAPVLTLPSVGGGSASVPDSLFALTLVDFWYLSCPPCLKAMPELERLHEQYGSLGLRVVGVNRDDDSAAVVRYLQRKSITYEVLLQGGRAAKQYGVNAFPTLFLVDPSGVIVHRIVGYDPIGFTELRKFIRQALNRD